MTFAQHVTFAQQVRPSESISRLDQLQPSEPEQVFLGFDKEEDAEVNKRLAKRVKKLGKLITKLEAEKIDVTEAELLEPTGTWQLQIDSSVRINSYFSDDLNCVFV